MKTDLAKPILLLLTVASTTYGADLINNLADPGQNYDPSEVGFGFGTSFQTGSEYYSTTSITLEHLFYDDTATPLQVRLLKVEPAGSENLVLVGEFPAILAGPMQPSGASDVTYSGVPVLLQANTEYVVLVDATDLVGSHLIGRADDTFSGSQAGYAFVDDWNSVIAPDGEFTFRQGLVRPLKLGIEGTPVENPNLPPDISDVHPSITSLWPHNGMLVPVTLLGGTDPNGDTVTLTVTSVYQDEEVNGGDAKLAPDADFLGNERVLLRAERIGSGSGRVYTISYEANDGHGGVSSGVVRVEVPLQRKTPAIDDGPLFDSTSTN